MPAGKGSNAGSESPEPFGNTGKLDRQALAALAAAAREHGLPVFRPHPDQETVCALAAAVVWLKGTLHDFVNPLKRKRGV